MYTLQNLWHKISPKFLILFVRFVLEPKSYKVRRKLVLKHYKTIDLKTQPHDIQEGIKFLKYHKFSPYPYYWTLKYEFYKTDVFFDQTYNCYYALFEGKKLYYPKKFKKNHVIWNTKSAIKEQEPNSPHLYLTNNFQVEPDSIVIDAGVAEGNFSLSIIDKVKKLYLIECDPAWIEALKLTFAPWKDKVVFIEKYLSDSNTENYINIDSIVQPDPNENYFIKMDIEGYEKNALAGMKNLIKTCPKIKMSICTYHHPEDLSHIEKIVKNSGFKCEVSDGHILYFQLNEEPTFRKALIRAEKK